MSEQPPHEEGLNIAALVRTLDNPNSSYKFLWLLSLLEIIIGESRDKDSALRIKMIDVVRRMLAMARDPIQTYKLYLGKDDRMGRILEDIDKDSDSAERLAFNRLKKYVPQQWLRLFSKVKEMPGRSDEVAKVLLKEASDSRVGNQFPYIFCEEKLGSDILVSRRWRRYFWTNYEIVKGWALYAFIDYLQQNNPSTPGIVAKIARPKERESLAAQRAWWNKIIRINGHVRCIYSWEKLSSGDFELDHYVPWSFVGHNRIWNLVPVIPEANQKKRDRLPNPKYLDKLIDVQRIALSTHVNHRIRHGKWGTWNKMLDAYTADLKLAIMPVGAERRGSVKRAFKQVLPPLLALAERKGFQSGWRWHA